MTIIEQLKRDEGLRLSTYTDTEGKRTIGYGHNLDANPLPFGAITPQQAEDILSHDVGSIWRDLQTTLPWIKSLDDPRCGVLTNMAFNLGVHGLLKFRKMLSATEHGLYVMAANEMRDSTWAVQVGARAVRLARQMSEGIWV